MSLHDPSNPSDFAQGLGGFAQGVVISTKDPKKRGRVRIRLLGTQADKGKIPDSKLPWIPVSQLGAGFGGVGEFPPNLRVGSKVIIGSVGGQQNGCVIGCIPNQDENKNRADQHAFVSGEDPEFYNAMGNTAEKRIRGGLTSPTGQPTTTAHVENLLKDMGSIFFTNGKSLESVINKTKIPDLFGGRLAAKALDHTGIGNVPFVGDLLNAQKFMQSSNAKELIPNAINMLEQLKKTAQSGQNILATASVGGLGNILGAVAGIAALVKKEKDRNNQQEQQESLEELLRRLYKEITGKEPLDEFGKETAQYIKWKEAYMRGEITDVKS